MTGEAAYPSPAALTRKHSARNAMHGILPYAATENAGALKNCNAHARGIFIRADRGQRHIFARFRISSAHGVRWRMWHDASARRIAASNARAGVMRIGVTRAT